MIFPDLKAWIKQEIGLSDAMLHVNFGLALFLALIFLFRKWPRGLWVAWAILLVLETGNELFDAWVSLGRSGKIDVEEAVKDFIATMFWPTVLLLIWKPLTRAGQTRQD